MLKHAGHGHRIPQSSDTMCMTQILGKRPGTGERRKRGKGYCSRKRSCRQFSEGCVFGERNLRLLKKVSFM